MRLRFLTSFVVAVTLLLTASTAHASFPGANGKIAYSATVNVYTVEPDGTGAQQLVPNARSPAWSPNGRQIAYSDGSRIWIANADGSQPHVILDFAADPYGYAIEDGIGWSPDAQRLVVSLGYYCADCLNEPSDLYTIGIDGSNAQSLPTSGLTVNSDPDWSPDGRLIAFYSDMNTPGSSRIFTIKPDGTGLTQVSNTPAASPSWSPDGQRLAFDDGGIYSRDMVTGVETKLTTDAYDGQSAWSPDGTKLAFSHGCPSACSTRGIYTINADGSARTQITAGANDQWPAWQPIQGPRRSDFRHAAKFCQAEQAFLGEPAFRHKYGNNGKCVSGK